MTVAGPEGSRLGAGSVPERALTLLVSSASARGRALLQGREITRILRAGGWAVHVKVTTGDSDVVFEAANCKGPLLGAIGGDGYLTAAARGCMESGAVLLPFPGGRGNDLCRSLGIGASAVGWAKTLAETPTDEVLGWTGPLDAMEVASKEGTQRVLGILSLGIDATACVVANDSHFRLGSLAYAWGTVAGYLGKFKPVHVKGSIEPPPSDPTQQEIPLDEYAWLCSVSNTGWFGGGINILPQSRTDDGILEIISVSDLSRLRALPKLAKVLLKRGLDDPSVSVYTGVRVDLQGPRGLVAMADGDFVGTLPLSLTAVPGALSVIRPPSASAED